MLVLPGIQKNGSVFKKNEFKEDVLKIDRNSKERL
tara:strand:+ start:1075 stop:1179 length:105 start_codon:yes stop_codon:yes gene_type:complete